MHDVLLVMLTTVVPVSELRGGIPLGVALGLDPWLVFVVAVVTNIAIFVPTRLALAWFYRSVFTRIPYFDDYLVRVRRKGEPTVRKYGLLGLLLFVAVPLPITGAYTGTVLSWLLAMEWKRSFIAVGIGVVCAGVIVMLATLGVISVATVAGA
ncbi:MAG: small multi-drug export protein [Dehalococcoidia bacterium]|nr:small multi-drug export protein [Dehalococcoidia bacterium]